jgi:PAS domain-containing protein
MGHDRGHRPGYCRAFWGESNPPNDWAPDPGIDLFRDFLPTEDARRIPQPISDIERLFVSEPHLVPEVVISQIAQWHGFVGEYRLPIFGLATLPYFPAQLTYFLTTVIDTGRFRPMIDGIIGTIEARENALDSFADAVMIIVCVAQAFMVDILSSFLITMAESMQRALNLLLFFPPSVTLHNATVLELLTEGDIAERKSGSSFGQAEKVISHSRHVVLLADRDLIVHDSNAAASRVFGIAAEDLRGRLLADILVAPPDLPAISTALASVADAIQGVQGTPIPDALPIATPDGRKTMLLLPTCLTQLGAFAKGQSVAHIRGVILQVTDLTEQRLREDAIESEVS